MGDRASRGYAATLARNHSGALELATNDGGGASLDIPESFVGSQDLSSGAARRCAWPKAAVRLSWRLLSPAGGAATRHLPYGTETPGLSYRVADGWTTPCGGSEAVYAAMAIMSSAVSFSTTGFMSCDQTPFRVPTCMSYNCRTI